MIGAADGDEPTEEQKQAAADAAAAAANEGKTLTQAELTEIMTREKNQGRRAGVKDALKDLGFESEADAKAFIEAQRDAETAKLSDQEKREVAIDARERAADERDRTGAVRERELTVKDSLRDLGAKGENLDDAMLLIGKLADDADDDTIVEFGEALKMRRPELFGDDEEETPRSRSKGNLPNGRPRERNTPKGGVFGAGGIERAKRKGWGESKS